VTVVANGGYCPTPYLVERIEKKKLSHKKGHYARLEPGIFKVVKEGMFNVVNDNTGTGQNAKLKDVSLSGKTGTAQPGTKGATHAWFIGFLPSEDPKFSFVVFLEHGGQGGADAANISKLLGIYLKENGFLDP
ncbi:MAG: hypothetical protein HQ572_05285, partial [Candidatus Omnitrophica bacterium]|nr:hypothetical protein [Candidatus Omnitrophota bacterium]